MDGLPPISDDYYKHKKKIRKITDDEVTNYINGGRILGKINQKLQEREDWIAHEKAPRQYFPFNPFKY